MKGKEGNERKEREEKVYGKCKECIRRYEIIYNMHFLN